MRKNLVLTLTGRDHVGIVEQVTKLVFEFDGNIEESRMARLGGEFAMLMLISAPANKFEEMHNKMLDLKDKGYDVNTCLTEYRDSENYSGWIPYKVEINGADHEGIIYHITHYLAKHGINIENMETSMVAAPMSGTPLFMMTAIIVVPPELHYPVWQNELTTIADKVNVDIEISPYKGY